MKDNRTGAEEVLWQMPIPSSGLSGVKFQKLLGRSCSLSFSNEDEPNKPPTCIMFDGVETFKCTYHNACTVNMVRLAYDKIVDLGATDLLSSVQGQLITGGDKNTGLRHLMIYFDGGPSYEFICKSFRVEA